MHQLAEEGRNNSSVYLELDNLVNALSKSSLVSRMFGPCSSLQFQEQTKTCLERAQELLQQKQPLDISDFEIFRLAEVLFKNHSQLKAINPSVMTLTQDLYLRVTEQYPVLFQLAKIRLFLISSNPNNVTKTNLQRLNDQAAIKILNCCCDPSLLFYLINHSNISREICNKVMDALWENIEYYDDTTKIKILSLLTQHHYIGKMSAKNFINRCSTLTEHIKGDTTDIQQNLEFYSQNRLAMAQLAFRNQRIAEGWKWLEFTLLQPLENCDYDEINNLALREIKVPDGCVEICNTVRLALLNYCLEHANFYDAKKYYQLINVESLTKEQAQIFGKLKDKLLEQEWQLLLQFSKKAFKKIENYWKTLKDPDEAYTALLFRVSLQKILADVTSHPGLTLEKKLDLFKHNLHKLLSDYWTLIEDKPLSYVYHTEVRNQEFLINRICIEFAEKIDPDRKMTILMPGVNENDSYGTSINQLKFGQFVLTQDNKNFIALKPLFENIIFLSNSGAQDVPLLSYLLPGKAAPIELNSSEIQNISRVLPYAQRFINAAYARINATQFTALGAVQRLREKLQKGDKLHKGSEEQATYHTYVATVEFQKWLDALSSTDRDLIENMSCMDGTFPALMAHLLRQLSENTEKDTSYICTYFIGTYFDSFITANRARLEMIGGGRGNTKLQLEWRELLEINMKMIDCPGIVTWSNTSESLIQYQDARKNPHLELIITMYRHFKKGSELFSTAFNGIHWFYIQLLAELDKLLNEIDSLAPTEIDEKLMRVKTAFIVHLLLSRNNCSAIESETPTFVTQTDLALLTEITESPYLCFDHKRIKWERKGTVGVTVKRGVIEVYTSPYFSYPIEIDYNRPETPFYIRNNKSKKYFTSLEDAITEIRINHLLPPALAKLIKQLNTSIYHPDNSLQLRANLFKLRTSLVDEAFIQLQSGKTADQIIKSHPLQNIIREINTMVPYIHRTENAVAKSSWVENCKKRLLNHPVGEKLGKVLLAVFIAAAVTATCAFAGFSVGALAVTGVAVTGINCYYFFKPSAVEKYIDASLQAARYSR